MQGLTHLGSISHNSVVVSTSTLSVSTLACLSLTISVSPLCCFCVTDTPVTSSPLCHGCHRLCHSCHHLCHSCHIVTTVTIVIAPFTVVITSVTPVTLSGQDQLSADAIKFQPYAPPPPRNVGSIVPTDSVSSPSVNSLPVVMETEATPTEGGPDASTEVDIMQK